MADVKAWREGTLGEPTFPDAFQVLQKAVLQVTDIKTNRNKYYAVELHAAAGRYRVYTHYGRTDDLDTTFEKVRASGAEVLQEPTSQPWGARDCAFRDPSGNLVRIAQS